MVSIIGKKITALRWKPTSYLILATDKYIHVKKCGTAHRIIEKIWRFIFFQSQGRIWCIIPKLQDNPNRTWNINRPEKSYYTKSFEWFFDKDEKVNYESSAFPLDKKIEYKLSTSPPYFWRKIDTSQKSIKASTTRGWERCNI